MTIRALIWQIPLLALCWIGVLACVALLQPAQARQSVAYLVLLPAPDFWDQVPPEAAIVGRSSISVTLAATTPQFAARLYRAGAWLVLPAGVKGCTGVPELGASSGRSITPRADHKV